MGWANESLFNWSMSHDQDGCHAHIMVKTLKNLLWDQKADDLETCYAASGAQVLQVCSNDDPGLTLTCFTSRSNLVPYAFVWEKGKTMDFSETVVVCDVKVGRCS